jgi:hypothetical protein
LAKRGEGRFSEQLPTAVRPLTTEYAVPRSIGSAAKFQTQIFEYLDASILF